ncbi:uncharacterized protein PV07_10518 [Cladophialophora immunda]|uniref:Uncharacterized protein n=1 Tax=Cladophialophora immunda TaxID=569365 RepID=A0A0D2C0H3_9EURO|nr:uncharacterized protein PV07_10518 [Cladophialophora immunda]KIW24828.1 hypothetical protein PV07_10518 [Cladophialophora immunda]
MATFHYQLDKIVIGLSHQLVCTLNEKQEVWKRVQFLQIHNSTVQKDKDILSKKLDAALHSLYLQKNQMKSLRAENREMRQKIKALAFATTLFKERLDPDCEASEFADEVLRRLRGYMEDTEKDRVKKSEGKLEACSSSVPLRTESTGQATDSSYETIFAVSTRSFVNK